VQLTTSDLVLPFWLVFTICIVVPGLALWKGGWPERVVAITFLLGWAATLIVADFSYQGPQWGGFVIDLATFAISVYVALRSDRYWTLFNAGFHFLSVVTHTARILDPTVGAWAYITAANLWSYLIMGALGIGVWGCVRRRRAAQRMHDAAGTAL
jgi:hypothetical protein